MFDLIRTFDPVPEEENIKTAPLLSTEPPPCNTHAHQESCKEKPSKDQLAEGAANLDPPIRFQRKHHHSHPLQQ